MTEAELINKIRDYLAKDRRELCVARIANYLHYSEPADRREVYKLLLAAWGTVAPFAVRENVERDQCGARALVAKLPPN